MLGEHMELLYRTSTGGQLHVQTYTALRLMGKSLADEEEEGDVQMHTDHNTM